MNLLLAIMKSREVNEYFDNLSEEEITRRLKIFLEILPFLELFFDYKQASSEDLPSVVKHSLKGILKDLSRKDLQIELKIT